jgi:peptidoglycan/xylan/chitin deacetylase (PgdA/CDA1 family)
MSQPTSVPTAIPILTYHQIDAPPAKTAPFRSLIVSPAGFARQMAALKFCGYTGLSMSALLPYLRGEKRGHGLGKIVGITLDDGYVNNLEHALPVLQRHGFSATCYMVSGQIGGSNVWDHAVGIEPKPLMNAAQLREWVALGQEVGGHTRNHVHLPALSTAAARTEIALCKTEIEQATGSAVQHFCYPYGDYALLHATLAQEAGFVSATTTKRGRATPQHALFELPRVPVQRATSLPQFLLKVLTRYEDRKR